MIFKSFKFDLGPMVRKQPDHKSPKRRKIKRQVFSDDILANPKKLSQTVVSPVQVQTALKLSPFGWRTLSWFSAGALAIVLALSGLVYLSSARNSSKLILGAATSAYEDLDSAGQNLQSKNLDAASALFGSAGNNLQAALGQLNEYKALTYITSQGRSASNLLKGAYLLSDAGRGLTESLKLFDELKVSSLGIETESFTDKLAQNRKLLRDSLNSLVKAQEHFADVSGVPLEYRESVVQARKQIGDLRGILENLAGLEDLYLSFVGDSPKTYLMVFQNYDEARATGGFIGTYGVVKIDRGEIKRLKIESVYQLDGQITEQVAAPGPFQPAISKWGLRDANWFADFPASARKLLYFFEKGGETADGVIGVTPRLFEQLISLTGPVVMQQYDEVLTSSNFQDVVQRETSVDYDKALNQPKKFLSDFAPILLNRLTNLDKEAWFSLFGILQDNLDTRDLMLYSSNSNTQSQISSLGFDGGVLSSPLDYLMIVNSNLGGTKTDLSMVCRVNLTTKILSDGMVINYLRIVRSNTADEANRNYLRVLVPMGSQLVSADGITEGEHAASAAEGYKTDPDLAQWDAGELMWNKVFVRRESGKTEFAAWIETPAHTTSEVTLAYTLPFRVKPGFWNDTATYSLLLQKQPGSKAFEFSQSMETEGLIPVWLSPSATANLAGANFKSQSRLDDYWGVVLKHE